MKKFIMALMMFVFLFVPNISLAEKIVFLTAEWPPYIISEKGQASGLSVEIVRELCKRLGYEPDIRLLSWKRALVYMKEGRGDAIFSPRHTEERSQFLYYPSEPLHMEKTVILAKKGSGMKADRLEDLEGKTVGVVRDYAYGSEFSKYDGIRKSVYDNDTELAKALSLGRISLITASDEGSLKYLCRQSGIKTEVVYVLNETPSYIAFSKARGEKSKTLAEKFGQMLRKLKEEGFIQKIEGKYF